jgi:diguanylate cyclase (GGDEF)-like protein
MFKNTLHRLSNIIDYFISDAYLSDTDMRYKARLLVGCTLSFMIGIIGFGPYYVTIPGLSWIAAVSYYFFAVPVVVWWLWLLRYTKQGVKYSFCSNSVIASTAAVLFGGILVTGGPGKTEVLPLITVPVVLAFMMVGQRSGLIWTVIVGSINYLLVFMDYFGVEFVNLAPPEAVKQLRVFNWSYSFFTIAALVMIYETMNRRLTNERNVERERFRHMAMHDVLTGLPNRKYFDEALQASLALADRSKTTVAVGLLDLNGFKPINDEVGHEAGDIVLQVVSQRMQEALRKSDKVARLGGDEFAFILNNVNSLEDVESVSDKILLAIANPIEVNDEGMRLNVSGSLGIALFPVDTRDENELRVFSDKAMYSAKRANAGWRLYSEIPDEDK